jgi:predicted nuclease of restriction endonuclease-like RecB superfamily
VLNCADFDLKAELRWGPQRRPKTFQLSPKDGLVSHATDSGMHVPAELSMFAELFRSKVAAWDLTEEADVLPLGDTFWVPDFRLVEKAGGREVLLEVLGFWRRSSLERHLARLRAHARRPFLLAVSDQLRVEDADLEGLPAVVYRFRQMPLPDEVARLAGEVLRQGAP